MVFGRSADPAPAHRDAEGGFRPPSRRRLSPRDGAVFQCAAVVMACTPGLRGSNAIGVVAIFFRSCQAPLAIDRIAKAYPPKGRQICFRPASFAVPASLGSIAAFAAANERTMRTAVIRYRTKPDIAGQECRTVASGCFELKAAQPEACANMSCWSGGHTSSLRRDRGRYGSSPVPKLAGGSPQSRTAFGSVCAYRRCQKALLSSDTAHARRELTSWRSRNERWCPSRPHLRPRTPAEGGGGVFSRCGQGCS